jgi:hypothetical protein
VGQAATDSTRQPATLYQVTSSTSHGTNLEGLKKVAEVTQEPAQATLYFAVPEEESGKFSVSGVKDLQAGVKRKELQTLNLRVTKLTYGCLRETR